MKKILSILLIACILISCMAAAGVQAAAEEQAQLVYLKYPKDNLNKSFPLVQTTKTGKYRLYAYCWTQAGYEAAIAAGDYEYPKRITCKFEEDQDSYLLFSADVSQAGVLQDNTDYLLQFFTQASTWTLTMTKECVGDTVEVTGESVKDSNEETVYFVSWQNNPKCGMLARLLPNNTLWCADKGCDKLPVYRPKATFISDALRDSLLHTVTIAGNTDVSLNTDFAGAEKNRANCEKLGIDPVDVYKQYAADNAKALSDGEPQQLKLNGQDVTAVLYNEKYIADLPYIAKVLGLTEADLKDPSQLVYLKYPKDNLNKSFPLVQTTKTGKYRLYAYCWTQDGYEAAIAAGDYEYPKRITCKFEEEQDGYLLFSADVSQAGALQDNTDYLLQFFTQASTWTLTMTKECVGDTVEMTGESVKDSNEETVYFVSWQNNPECGMLARLLANNTLWCADKGCDKLPVYRPKAAFISDALKESLLRTVTTAGNTDVSLNADFADVEKNRANCEKLGVLPSDVFSQYEKDYASLLSDGESTTLSFNGESISAVLYNGKYIAGLTYISKVLGLPGYSTAPLFRTQFYRFASWEGVNNYEDMIFYDEMYYHYDDNNDMDWVLVYGTTWYETAQEVYAVLGNRVVTQSSGHVPFVLGYGVYDVKADTFTDLGLVYNSDRYEGLKEAVEEQKIGTLIGDMNDDDKVNIKDATAIQKALAGLADYPKNDDVTKRFINAYPDYMPSVSYLSDTNKNGSRDIGDATTVQKIAAGMITI